MCWTVLNSAQEAPKYHSARVITKEQEEMAVHTPRAAVLHRLQQVWYLMSGRVRGTEWTMRPANTWRYFLPRTDDKSSLEIAPGSGCSCNYHPLITAQSACALGTELSRHTLPTDTCIKGEKRYARAAVLPLSSKHRLLSYYICRI